MITLSGHRARMRDRVDRIGAEGMRSLDLLEVLLYYCAPRRDMRQQAGALLERFGSMQGVLNADQKQLMSVPGIGAQTARWICEIRALMGAYVELKGTDKPRINNFERSGRYFKSLFSQCTYPEVWQINLNAGGRLISGARISDNASWAESEYLFDALDSALSAKAQNVIIGQFSTTPGADFEDYDIKNTISYGVTLSAAGINLLDHVFICPDTVRSMFVSGALNNERIRIKPFSLREGYLNEDIPDPD